MKVPTSRVVLCFMHQTIAGLGWVQGLGCGPLSATAERIKTNCCADRQASAQCSDPGTCTCFSARPQTVWTDDATATAVSSSRWSTAVSQFSRPLRTSSGMFNDAVLREPRGEPRLFFSGLTELAWHCGLEGRLRLRRRAVG